MKTLKNHIILYDGECPMCKLYTGQFIKRGMLGAGGRAPYQQMPEIACPYVDRQRAVNEIALVNTKTGDVEYGVKSLFKVIANSFPVFEPLFSFQPFIWLMSKYYSFISYNRRVIAPAVSDGISINPSFSLKHRLTFLVFTWLTVGFILTHYAALLMGYVPLGHTWREYAICGGQIVFQGIIISLYAPTKRWDYLGNMMTISFAGALMLVPLGILSRFVHFPSIVYPLFFLLVAGLMFLEHVRRTRLMQLGWMLTITWAVYRILVLLIILKLF